MVTLTDDTGTAYNIAGSTGLIQLRSEPGASVVLTPTYAIEDGPNGELSWSSPASETEDLAPGVYQYAVRVTFSDTTVRTILEGRVTVRRVAVS